jgi:MFS family permease
VTRPPPPARGNPWWIPFFLGRVPPAVEERHLRLLGAVALALFFEEYDLAMIISALKFIAADLGVVEQDLGWYLGLIRLGAVPAFVVIPFADRLGRRRVFIASVVAMAVLTFATAFARTAGQFVALQCLVRTFFVTGAAVGFVMITEEFPAAERGWGIGMLGALAVSGHGLAAILFAGVDRLPWGWRSLYAFGALPLLLLPHFRRAVPETERFRRYREDLSDAEQVLHLLGWVRPLRSLAATHPGRALGIAIAAFLPAVGAVSALQFTGYFTQTVHGWSPGQYSAMVLLGGAIGIAGNVVAGRLGDRFGRRVVGIALLGLFPLFVTAFYRGPGWLLAPVWVAFLFCFQGGRMILRALSTELFPTAHRGAASGLYTILDAVGSAGGLFLLWAGSGEVGDTARLVPWLSALALLGGLVLAFFPETRRRELEAI